MSVDVEITGSTSSSITVGWDVVVGATGYLVYRDSNLMADVTDGSTGYTDAAPELYTCHIYTVVAYGTEIYDVGSVAAACVWPDRLPDLVTDRTKGAYYNAVDLNRVESAVQYLAGQLRAAPEDLKTYAEALGVAWDALFDVPYDPGSYTVGTKTNWTMEDLPTKKEMKRYLSNVVTITGALRAAYPELPTSIGHLTWSGANAIERALRLLHDALTAERNRITVLLDNTEASWYYAAEIYAGEV